MTAGHREEHSTFYTSSSTEGSQKDITLHAEAIIMYFGLNCNKKELLTKKHGCHRNLAKVFIIFIGPIQIIESSLNIEKTLAKIHCQLN